MAITKPSPLPLPITYPDVEAAARRLRDHLLPTPQSRSQTLSRETGSYVTVKFENLQFTASFKERGALNKMLLLDDAERTRGVIAVSAGNHAQGVARHAALLGIPATVVMPATTPITKVNRTRVLGARVVLEGETFEDACDLGVAIAAKEGLVMIHPYNDPAVMAGQGTVAMEMLADDAAIEALVVPVGGGGLISGIATVAKTVAPEVEVIGVQTELYAGMAKHLKGVPADGGAGGPTVAEGIAVREPGELARVVVKKLVDDIIVVPETAIETAIGVYLEVEKVLAEGAGAAPLAALMENRDRFAGRRVGLVLSGGNLDLRFLADVILRDLARTGQLCWIRLEAPDFPGTLARITSTVAHAGANIVDVIHRRHGVSVSSRGASLDLHLECNGSEHLANVTNELEKEGFKVVVIDDG